MNQPIQALGNVSYDATLPAVVVTSLIVRDPAVVTEALRWSTGRRDEAVGSQAMADVDLSAFVTQALVIGAHAIISAGGTQDKFDLERLVTEVGTRTTEASAHAAQATAETVARVADAMEKVSADARKAIAEASEQARKSFTDNVESATKALHDDVQRLLGGDHPELIDRLNPLLESFSQRLDKRTAQQTQDLIAKAARQFDPADPASPMAKHTTALKQQQATLTASLEKNHLALVAKVDELATAVQVAASASSTAQRIMRGTPLKGGTYAEHVHLVMQEIAAGLGDEYDDTGNVIGSIPRCKKGDGLLTVNGGVARVVLEMTDSTRPGWNDYLDEAERNRDAAASLGLVRDPAQNGGHTVRCLGSRRIILAFDPANDDTQLLRTVVQLLRIAAISASSRRDEEDLQTADEKLAEALAMLSKIDDIQKAAASIHKSATKIEGQCTAVQTGLNRLLTDAQAALAGLGTDGGELIAAVPAPRSPDDQPSIHNQTAA